MRPVAWRFVQDWNCIACGQCCKEYTVVLRFNEWLNIVRHYGVETTVPGLNKIYLRKRSDGSCIFLRRIGNLAICGLQHMKPQACKLWPFKIYTKPRYGQEKQALYEYRTRKFFVYVDPACRGIRWGTPTRHFMSKVVPEFIQIAFGTAQKQKYSTANINQLLMQQLIKPKVVPVKVLKVRVS